MKRLPVRRIAALFGVGIASLKALDNELGLSSRRKFAGKTVLITGGSRGLGLLLARKLATVGAKLVLVARNEEELDRARKELESLGAEVLTIASDVSKKTDVEKAMRLARERFGVIDVLINDAGIMEVGDIRSMSLKDMKDVMAVNFWGVANTSWALLPEMIRRETGMIINITSIGGAIAVPHLLPYTASKHAALGFSQGLSMELGQYGIQVTTIVPGLMRTGSFLQALFKGEQESEFRWFSIGAALPGLSMSADRAASQILASAARGERFVTLGMPAKAARLIYSAAPDLSVRIASLINRLLPRSSTLPQSTSSQPLRSGKQTRARTGKIPLTGLGEAAAKRNNEVA